MSEQILLRSKYTYQDGFYMVCGKNGRASKSKYAGKIYGWPFQRGPWCNSRLKQHVLEKLPKEAVQYVGIACDEPGRFHVFGEKKKSPLVEAGWDEVSCRRWCEENDLLSPIYTTATRGGVGSAIIRGSNSCGSSAGTTLTYGR